MGYQDLIFNNSFLNEIYKIVRVQVFYIFVFHTLNGQLWFFFVVDFLKPKQNVSSVLEELLLKFKSEDENR